MRASVTDKDNGYKRLMRELEKSGAHVAVGVLSPLAQAQHGDEPGMTTLKVAVINEFGVGHVPERSFLRSTADAERNVVMNMLRAHVAHIARGRGTVFEALSKVGMYMQAKITKTIVDMRTPPNAPSTIRAKAKKAGMSVRKARAMDEARAAQDTRRRVAYGPTNVDAMYAQFNNPLVDTGQLAASIRYRVEMGTYAEPD